MSDEGQSSGSGTEMHIPSVWELGDSLLQRNQDMQEHVNKMNEAFSVKDGRAAGDFAFGRGWGRHVGMYAMEGNMTTMEKAMSAVESFRKTNEALGNIAIYLANKYQTADALNNASLEEIQQDFPLESPEKPQEESPGGGYVAV